MSNEGLDHLINRSARRQQGKCNFIYLIIRFEFEYFQSSLTTCFYILVITIMCLLSTICIRGESWATSSVHRHQNRLVRDWALCRRDSPEDNCRSRRLFPNPLQAFNTWRIGSSQLITELWNWKLWALWWDLSHGATTPALPYSWERA